MSFAIDAYHHDATRAVKTSTPCLGTLPVVASYHRLRDEVPYRDLGADRFDRRDKAKLTNRLIRRLKDLGVHVEVRPAA